MFSESDLSEDEFLCGRLRLLQPLKGYRAATDPVLLAAACPARTGDSVLDLGCGAGAAALCLGLRVPGLALSGLELQPDYADLARRNADRNGIPLEVHAGDIARMPKPLRRDFDHVIANPPYYPAGGSRSPEPGRATAMQVATPLGDWVTAAARRLRPKIFPGTSISWDKPGKRQQCPQTVTQYSNWFANRSLLWPSRGCRAVSCFSRW